jgi:hypothetical protein
LHVLFLRALRDDGHLVSKLTLKNDALVDDRGHAIKKLAGIGEFLGDSDGRSYQCDDYA